MHERVAQYLLGHADSRVTKEIYTHVTGRCSTKRRLPSTGR